MMNFCRKNGGGRSDSSLASAQTQNQPNPNQTNPQASISTPQLTPPRKPSLSNPSPPNPPIPPKNGPRRRQTAQPPLLLLNLTQTLSPRTQKRPTDHRAQEEESGNAEEDYQSSSINPISALFLWVGVERNDELLMMRCGMSRNIRLG